MRNVIRVFAFGVQLAVLWAFAALSTMGQVNTATLSGAVLDPQKAGVAGAKVTARAAANGLERSTEAGSDGSYTITNLEAGTYDVTAEAKGFSRSAVKGLVLEVGRTASLEFNLKLTGTAESVVVLEELAGVETTRSTIEGVVNQRAIDELPLNGRNFTELAFLLPGNTSAPSFDPTKARAVEVSPAAAYCRLTGLRQYSEFMRLPAFLVPCTQKSTDVRRWAPSCFRPPIVVPLPRSWYSI